MAKSIVIIGAGMGGMAAGVYGQVNGYDTRIFEMHTKPGGQCASWTRNGYTFDACIHHFFGCLPGTGVYQVWQELGAMPRELVAIEECTAVASADGKVLIDYYDPERLESALLALSPGDAKAIGDYLRAVRAFSRNDVTGLMLGASVWKMMLHLPGMLSIQRWTKLNMRTFAERFSDPFLKRAFERLVYSEPNNPMFFHLLRHAGGMSGDIKWPVGGAADFAKSIEKRYLALGGHVHYRSPVEKILVENDTAVGIRLADGNEQRADIVISNADGRKTILEMLEGKYLNDTVRGYCAPISDETPFALDVFFGINRDLSAEPSSLILLLAEPATIAGHSYESIELQTYGFDKGMAPAGKGIIKVELPASYKYWKGLHDDDREEYERQKQKAAEQVIGILGNRFPGIEHQVEVVDVTTLATWERYMGGTQGWFNLPNRTFDFSLKEDPSDKKFKTTLPGLSIFYFVGVWATMMGSLFHNAHSGKAIIRRICKKEGKAFKEQPQLAAG